MIRLSREADYALVLLAQIARARPTGGAGVAEDEHPSARQLAAATGLPLPMVGKVLKTLARGGLLESRRGSQGGYALALAPEAITIAGLVQALEGPIGLTDCSPGRERTCDYEDHCATRGPVIRVNAVLRQALEGVTLAQIVSDARPAQLLQPTARPPEGAAQRPEAAAPRPEGSEREKVGA